jgi:hypothetical protein
MDASDICTKLEAATGLDVYPQVSPDNSVAPFVIYNRTSMTPLRTLAGATGVFESLYRIDAYDFSFDAALLCAGKIRDALSDWTDASIGVLSSSLEAERDLSDLTSDPKLNRVQVEIRILHR